MTHTKRYAWLVWLVVVCAPTLALAIQYPPRPAATVKGTALPVGGVLIKSGSAVVSGYRGFNNFGGVGWWQLHPTAVQPGAGAIPAWSTPATANNAVALATIPSGGIKMANVYLVCSTVADSYSPATDCPAGGSYSVELR